MCILFHISGSLKDRSCLGPQGGDIPSRSDTEAIFRAPGCSHGMKLGYISTIIMQDLIPFN